jgi:hypothetical protein
MESINLKEPKRDRGSVGVGVVKSTLSLQIIRALADGGGKKKKRCRRDLAIGAPKKRWG